MKAITVTELNNKIKSVLDAHFEVVLVEGEVSKVTYHSSGHLYFTVKDDNSSIDCAMWRSNLRKINFKLKPGDNVFLYGAVNVYVPRGEYKLIVSNIEPIGVGALQLEYERLLKELRDKGYFENKKPLPKFPKKIALITSKTGAALQDMLRVAQKRWGLSKFYLFNTLVQGREAGVDIARNIEKANNFIFEDGSRFDLIIVSRGGGSKEDLWCFNERVVAEAIHKSDIPLISAVGHEIDVLISDYVADKRAATPSNAMEIALPDRNEILQAIDEMIDRFEMLFQNILRSKESSLYHLKEVFEANSPLKKIENKKREVEYLEKDLQNVIKNILQEKELRLDEVKREFNYSSFNLKLNKYQNEISNLKTGFENSMKSVLNKKENNLKSLEEQFKLSNPKNREKEGFAEIVKDNKRIKLEDINEGDEFIIENTNSKILSKALKKFS